MANTPTTAARTTFDHTRTWRRLQRSSNAPANGPISEYGSKSTAKPAAMSAGRVLRVGSKSTTLASAP